jgi:hypothetical protein
MATQLYSGSGDFTVSETLNRLIILSLADRAYVGNHEALLYAGDAQGSGSTVMKIPELGLDGYDSLAAPGENTAATETAFTDTSHTITVARQAITRNVSDLLRIVDQYGAVSDPASLVRDAMFCASGRLMDLIAGLADNFTATVGTTGVDLDFDDLIEAAILLDIANANTGRKMTLLHSRQWGDVQQDVVANASGALAERADTQQLLDMSGGSFRQTVLGDIDIFVSNRVVDAGADYKGGMWTRGGILWADSSIPVDPTAPPNSSIYAGFVGSSGGAKLLVEFDRDIDKWMRKTVYNVVLGASQGQDSAGVTIISED